MTNENDCISREEAIKTVWPYVDGDLIANDIKNLPSVKPLTITDFADKCRECGKILNDKLQESNTAVVNLYEVELMLERLIERDMDDQYVKKPIAHALYLTWKWADENERSRDDVRTE